MLHTLVLYCRTATSARNTSTVTAVQSLRVITVDSASDASIRSVAPRASVPLTTR